MPIMGFLLTMTANSIPAASSFMFERNFARLSTLLCLLSNSIETMRAIFYMTISRAFVETGDDKDLLVPGRKLFSQGQC